MENFFLKLSVMLVPGMLAIVCHEVSHGYVAWRFGDPTARMMGRLTLNPLKHIDIVGTLMIFFIGIGGPSRYRWCLKTSVTPNGI